MDRSEAIYRFGGAIYSRISSMYSLSTMTVEEPVSNGDMKKQAYSTTPNYEDGTGLFSQLLTIDDQITTYLARFARPQTQTQNVLKTLCMCLELSGHGVPWFAFSGLLLALYFYTGEDFYFNYGLNLLSILVMDVSVVAPLKLLFKRPRPALNRGTIPMSITYVDSYAFPSGHASRCVALAALFCYLPPFHVWTHCWYIWAIVVSLSRVGLGRHHVLDIGAGVLAGFVVFDLVRRFGLLVGI